jgi:hypothetical protein
MRRVLPWLALLTGAGLFWIFSFNSGYGYDALEYLVIARGLNEGIPLYAYLPSKSPGIYWIVASLMRLGLTFDHASLASVLTALFVLVVLSTHLVVSKWFDGPTALLSAVLTACVAPFMEMNFLEPTAFVYLAGLGAFHFMQRYGADRADRSLVCAGVFLGAGIAFKSTAAFFGLACGIHLLQLVATRRIGDYALVRAASALAAGAVTAIGAVAAWFALDGRFSDFVQWTFTFPLLHYPTNTTYVDKIYTKLLWPHLVILGCIPVMVLNREVRREIWDNMGCRLALIFGVCAYLALMKTQASHYFFPGAPFLFLFASSVYVVALKQSRTTRSRALQVGSGVAALAVAAVASVLIYRPAAAARLWSIRDFTAEEAPLREYVQARVPADRYVLFAGGGTVACTMGYWITHRYPPPPFINADVKTIYTLRTAPDEVFRVIEDPKLVLVQFEPDQLVRPRMEDVFGERAGDVSLMREYLARVGARFIETREAYPGMTFWQARSSAVGDPPQ